MKKSLSSYGEPAILAYSTRYSYTEALTETDFELAREVIGVLRPLADFTNGSHACPATGSQVLPTLYALKEEYASGAPTDVPMRGDFNQVVAVANTALSESARQLRKAIADDIEVNVQHLALSRDTLLKATVVDPRF